MDGRCQCLTRNRGRNRIKSTASNQVMLQVKDENGPRKKEERERQKVTENRAEVTWKKRSPRSVGRAVIAEIRAKRNDADAEKGEGSAERRE